VGDLKGTYIGSFNKECFWANRSKSFLEIITLKDGILTSIKKQIKNSDINWLTMNYAGYFYYKKNINNRFIISSIDYSVIISKYSE